MAMTTPAFAISLPRLTTAAALSALLLQPLPCGAFTSAPQAQPSQRARLVQPQPPSAPAPDFALDAEHALVDEVWQLVNRYYIDSTFNHTDWSALRQKLQSTPLPSRKATYDATRSMLAKLSDRYTRMLTPDQMRLLRKFDVSGVGLLFTTNARGDLVVATEPASDTSAGRAGVKRGDVLLEIGGVDVNSVGAFGASQMMQGKEGTDLDLKFRDIGQVSLKREFGDVQTVRWRVIDSEDGKLGYVRLKEFRASAREQVEEALENVLEQGAEWVVLDLRGNGGGVFEGALEIAGLVEGNDKAVVRVKGRTEIMGADVPTGEEVFTSRVVGKRVLEDDVDMAVVLDGGSASSSEVLAGGLRSMCRAALVGEKSFGKGLIQGVFGLSDGGGVVLTVAEYKTPGGGDIQGVGLKPDLEIKRSGWEKALKMIGVVKLDDVAVSREDVRQVVRNCVPEV